MKVRGWMVGLVASGLIVGPASVWADEDDDDAVIIELDDEDETDDQAEEDDEFIIELDEVDEEVVEDADEEFERVVGTIQVIGQRPQEIASVPGSATIVTEEDLESQAPTSGNEVLRTIPGVHVRDEEGIGLRPNIGIRGLDPSRSRQILALEDGVPIALAPYGEPELYYAPAIERMERVELVKGSGSILFGPQTIGGVVNYITADPPEEFQASAELRAGNFGYYGGRATVGDTVGDFGYHLGVMHQRFEGPRALNLRVTDVTGKGRYEFSPMSNIIFKAHFYDESSNATYLGLTQPQFEENRNFNFAENDVLAVNRYGLSLTHNHLFGTGLLLQTTAYGYYTARPWNRQDFDRADEGRNYDRVIDGTGRDVTGALVRPEDGSAVFFRDTMSERDREFYVGGIEPRATMDFQFGQVDNELIFGARIHSETAFEERIDSDLDGGDVSVRASEVRQGYALAAYAQNRFMLFDERLQVSPGLRVETFWNERRIDRTRVDGEPTDLDPPRSNSDTVVALIPGMGLSYQLIDELTLFAGVHRGFAPPRTKDAVTTDGDLLELDAEYSINYEVGLRGQIQDYLAGSLAGFVLDFSNQIIPPAEAAGATADSPGGLINEGETTHFGVEADVRFDTAALLDLGFQLPLGVTYTWVHAEFGDAWRPTIRGNRLPYAPEHRLSTFLRFVHPTGISAQLNGIFISEQYTDLDNTQEPTTDGLAGKIDPYFLLDARISYTYQPWGITAFVAGKNLADQNYVVSRAPRGIQPGMPRQLFGGIKGEL